MPLTSLTLDLRPDLLPDAIHDLIDEADRRCDAFYESGEGKRFPKYVPSDPTVVHAALAFLNENQLARGKLFCEWGSGFGVATAIAGKLGYEAIGIEIEEPLVRQSLALAGELGIPVEILHRSFLPDGYEVSDGMGGVDLLKPHDRAAPVYDELEVGGIDVFFVYPWPGEEDFVMALFDEVSTEGAILLVYLGEGELAGYRQEG